MSPAIDMSVVVDRVMAPSLLFNLMADVLPGQTNPFESDVISVNFSST